jgi:uncharacterized protein (TIGR02596 family)
MLVVIGILTGLMVLAVPAFQGAIKGSRITGAGQLLADQFSLARQEAVTRSRDVQVRLVWLGADARGPGAIQLWSADPRDLTIQKPIGKLLPLPEKIIVSPEAKISPLLSNSAVTQGEAEFGTWGKQKYRAFRFRPDGGTSLAFDSAENFLTVVPELEAAETPPANYSTIQVDPANGRSRLYRP